MTGLTPNAAQIHLAVALDGAGWHPAAWREKGARPDDLLTARYWADLTSTAERGLLDFVTIEDSLDLQSADPFSDDVDTRTDQVRGRLDALLVAATVAPLTRHVGLVPTVTTTHTEPFHVSKAVATLDHVSHGRAGWRVQVGRHPGETGNVGRRTLPRSDGTSRHPRGPRCRAAIASTRLPTTSRSSGGSGTAGRTTPRSATSRPGVRRPGPAAPRRLRGPALQRPRPVDHPATATGAASSSPPWRTRRLRTSWRPGGATSSS